MVFEVTSEHFKVKCSKVPDLFLILVGKFSVANGKTQLRPDYLFACALWVHIPSLPTPIRASGTSNAYK